MSGIWTTDDKLFVDWKLEVKSFDLKFASSPSESLPVEKRSGLDYNGPRDEKFKHFLSKMGYLVNNKGRVIIAVPRDQDDEVEAFHYFLLEKVIPLVPYGFRNKPIPKNQEETILRAELAKKNDELNDLRSQLDNIKAELLLKNTTDLEEKKLRDELAKKNDELNDFLRQLDNMKMNRVIVVRTNSEFLGFCLRMNRTYVNSEGDFIKFDFTAIDAAFSYAYSQTLYYCDEDCWISSPFTWVQYDESIPEQEIVSRRFYEPSYGNSQDHGNPGTWLVNEALSKSRNCLPCAFIFGQYRFYGQIIRTSGTFQSNALVSSFFDQCRYDGKCCYVDALGSTFFVLEKAKSKTWDSSPLGKPPRLLD